MSNSESAVDVDTGGSHGPAMGSGETDANGNPVRHRVFKTVCVYVSFVTLVREFERVNTLRL